MKIIKRVVSLVLVLIFITGVTLLGISLRQVKFVADNKTKTKIVFKNSLVKPPTFKLKDDKKIEGWYLDKEYKKQWNLDLDKIEKPITLYGKALETLNVNVYRDDILASDYLFKDYSEYNPKRLGYKFKGLYLDKNFNNKLNQNLTAADIGTNVYEKWEIEAREIAIMTIDLDDVLLADIGKESYVEANINLFNTEEDYILTDVLAGFRGRGNTSWTRFDKKGYKIKFDKSQSLFGCVKNKHYALVAEGYDTSMSKNKIAYTLGRDIFSYIEYSTQVNYVDLYVNGDYHGVYLLLEHRRVGAGRVDIESKFGEHDTGYLVEYDARAHDGAVKGIGYFKVKGLRHPFELKSPDPDDYESKGEITEAEFREQVKFIQNYIEKAVASIYSGKYEDINEYIDINSMVDMYILQELVKNYDVGWSSQYLYKKPGGKLYFGPPWDFDISAGCNYSSGLKSHKGLYVGNKRARHPVNHQNELYISIIKNSWFVDLVKERILELEDDLKQAIKDIYQELYTYTNSFELNYQRWPNKTAAKKEPKDYLLLQQQTEQWYLDRLQWLVDWSKK